jgi:predicted GNAT family N-acyltransferase
MTNESSQDLPPKIEKHTDKVNHEEELSYESSSKESSAESEEGILSHSLDFLYPHVLNETISINSLFDAIRIDSPNGLRDLEKIEQLYQAVYRRFIDLSHTPDLDEYERDEGVATANVLNQFASQARFILSAEFETSVNYLLAKKMEYFASRCGISEDAHLDLDFPFEITRGQYATFDASKEKLFIANPETSKQIKEDLEQADIPYLEEQGQYFARHQVLHIPDEWINTQIKIENEGISVDTMDLGRVLQDPEIISDYIHILRSDVRQVIEAEFGFELKDLTIREQIGFISFTKDVRIFEADMVKKYTHEYGTVGAQTFLALNSLAPDMGWAYISFAEYPLLELKSEILKVFKLYIEIEHKALETEEYLSRNFNVQDKAIIQGTIFNIRRRAVEIFSSSLNSINQLLSGQVTRKQWEKAIRKVKADTILFTTAFRALKDSGQLDIESIRGTSFETETGQELGNNEKDRSQITSLMEEAYKGQPEEFTQAVLTSLDQSFDNPNSKFYLLRRNDKVISALRFDDIKNEKGEVTERYFGSFVSDSAYGNGKLGEAVFEKAIEAESAKGEPISAHCNPLSPISQKYIEAGFVATELEDYADVPSFSIRLDSKINELSQTKRWKPEQIIQAALSQNTDTIQVFSVHRPEEIPFNLVNEGFALTRYLKQGNRIYAVFEKLPQAVSSGNSDAVSEDAEKGTA